MGRTEKDETQHETRRRKATRRHTTQPPITKLKHATTRFPKRFKDASSLLECNLSGRQNWGSDQGGWSWSWRWTWTWAWSEAPSRDDGAAPSLDDGAGAPSSSTSDWGSRCESNSIARFLSTNPFPIAGSHQSQRAVWCKQTTDVDLVHNGARIHPEHPVPTPALGPVA